MDPTSKFLNGVLTRGLLGKPPWLLLFIQEVVYCNEKSINLLRSMDFYALFSVCRSFFFKFSPSCTSFVSGVRFAFQSWATPIHAGLHSGMSRCVNAGVKTLVPFAASIGQCNRARALDIMTHNPDEPWRPAAAKWRKLPPVIKKYDRHTWIHPFIRRSRVDISLWVRQKERKNM